MPVPAPPPPDDLHSRLVGWLKLLLPLLALAILSTLFLFARQIGGEGQLPYAEVELQDMANDQRLTAPEFSGTTEDGAAVTMRARTARPARGTEGASVDQVAARYDTPAGLGVELRAEAGRLTPDSDVLTLERGVEMTTSTGYRLTATDLAAALNRTEIRTDNPVQVQAPFGRIEAGAMHLRPGSPDPASGAARYDLMFNKGVRMLYQPES